MILRLGPDKTSDLIKWHFRTLLTFPELEEGKMVYIHPPVKGSKTPFNIAKLLSYPENDSEAKNLAKKIKNWISNGRPKP